MSILQLSNKGEVYSGENPIGRDILIKNEYFTIVGSLDEKSFFAMNEQNSIFMPQNIATNTIRKINGIPGFGILSKMGYPINTRDFR